MIMLVNVVKFYLVISIELSSPWLLNIQLRIVKAISAYSRGG